MSQLISCPECKKNLQVPEELMGKKVQCPECRNTFTAAPPDEEPRSKTGTTASKPAPSKTPDWEKDESSSSKSGSGKKSRKRDDDDDDEEEDDDDDDGDRPRRRSRRSKRSLANRGHYMPHRGGMILAFGLIGLLVIPIFGIVAWVMGNTDLAEIRAGRMDPEGEGMTQAGKVIGMISVILWIVGILVFCGIFGCFFFLGLMGAAAAANNQQNFNQPRRRF